MTPEQLDYLRQTELEAKRVFKPRTLEQLAMSFLAECNVEDQASHRDKGLMTGPEVALPKG